MSWEHEKQVIKRLDLFSYVIANVVKLFLTICSIINRIFSLLILNYMKNIFQLIHDKFLFRFWLHNPDCYWLECVWLPLTYGWFQPHHKRLHRHRSAFCSCRITCHSNYIKIIFCSVCWSKHAISPIWHCKRGRLFISNNRRECPSNLWRGTKLQR